MTKETLIEMINEEANKRNIKVSLEDHPSWDISLAFFGHNLAAVAVPGSSVIIVFLDNILEAIDQAEKIANKLGKWFKILNFGRSLESSIKKMISDVLIHENRHLEQFKYLEKKGYDPIEVLTKANQMSSYYMRRHEIDAYMKQYLGFGLPLSWVFKKVAP